MLTITENFFSGRYAGWRVGENRSGLAAGAGAVAKGGLNPIETARRVRVSTIQSVCVTKSSPDVL